VKNISLLVKNIIIFVCFLILFGKNKFLTEIFHFKLHVLFFYIFCPKKSGFSVKIHRKYIYIYLYEMVTFTANEKNLLEVTFPRNKTWNIRAKLLTSE
jgi:hypothetical protein